MRWSPNVHLGPIRHSQVPWLWASDLEEGSQAVWEVDHRVNEDRVSCWHVPLYEPQKSTCGYLVLHAIRGNGNDGGEITLSLSHTPRYDVYAKDVLSTAPAQSNPNRKYVYRSKWETE
jgi:hypothetical protein